MNTKIKICGVKQVDEIQLLDKLGVSYAGLWYGIPSGHHNLDLNQLEHLSSTPTTNMQYLLVTMLQDITLLAEAIERSGVSGIQFHGFQLPAFIKKFKSTFGDAVKIFKVLHVRGDQCVEEDFIERYLESGADVLILDSYQDKERIGSTGVPISGEFIDHFFSHRHLDSRVMIAGGIDESNIEAICLKHRPYGIDIDSAARSNGIITGERIAKLIAKLPY